MVWQQWRMNLSANESGLASKSTPQQGGCPNRGSLGFTRELRGNRFLQMVAAGVRFYGLTDGLKRLFWSWLMEAGEISRTRPAGR